MKRANKYKLKNKIILKKGVIIVEKVWKKIVDKRVSKVIVIYYALVKTKKTAYNTIVRL